MPQLHLNNALTESGITFYLTLMRAPWILDDPSPRPGYFAHTVIAKWWPGRYFLVSTICLDGTSVEARLISSLETGLPLDEALPLPERFLTQVFRCDADGFVRSRDNPLFEKQYTTRADVNLGHTQVVARFSE
jgi:hypothetical protein